VFRYTSLAALALIDQGRLGLDDPVTKWLPYFTPPSPDGESSVITVRNLLNHTAGLAYGFSQPVDGPYRQAGASDGIDSSGLTLEENLRRLATVPLLFRPDEQWRYSLATDVLGAVIVVVHGKPLPAAVHDLVTGPLGLWDTGFVVVDASRLSAAYRNGEGGAFRMADEQYLSWGTGRVHFSPGRVLDPTAFPSGGAGMVGTTPDFLRALEELRRGGGVWFGRRLTLAQLNADPVGVDAARHGVKVREDGKMPSPHTFRHSKAMQMLKSGASMAEVQSFLGHADILLYIINRFA